MDAVSAEDGTLDIDLALDANEGLIVVHPAFVPGEVAFPLTVLRRAVPSRLSVLDPEGRAVHDLQVVLSGPIQFERGWRTQFASYEAPLPPNSTGLFVATTTTSGIAKFEGVSPGIYALECTDDYVFLDSNVKDGWDVANERDARAVAAPVVGYAFRLIGSGVVSSRVRIDGSRHHAKPEIQAQVEQIRRRYERHYRKEGDLYCIFGISQGSVDIAMHCDVLLEDGVWREYTRNLIPVTELAEPEDIFLPAVETSPKFGCLVITVRSACGVELNKLPAVILVPDGGSSIPAPPSSISRAFISARPGRSKSLPAGRYRIQWSPRYIENIVQEGGGVLQISARHEMRHEIVLSEVPQIVDLELPPDLASGVGGLLLRFDRVGGGCSVAVGSRGALSGRWLLPGQYEGRISMASGERRTVTFNVEKLEFGATQVVQLVSGR